MTPVVAIDGPVAVGKSSVARRVAAELGIRHLDTGAMYRAVAIKVMNLPPQDSENRDRHGEIAENLSLEFDEHGAVFLDGEDITTQIRDESVSRFVALVADNRRVREALVAQQQLLGRRQPSVLEGRDIGTVVFPDAAVKIYLDASPEVRVARRVAQLEAMGLDADREEVYASLAQRDQRDRSRSWGALRMASDAVMVDTTDFDEDMVVRLICSVVRQNSLFRQALATTTP